MQTQGPRTYNRGWRAQDPFEGLVNLPFSYRISQTLPKSFKQKEANATDNKHICKFGTPARNRHCCIVACSHTVQTSTQWALQEGQLPGGALLERWQIPSERGDCSKRGAQLLSGRSSIFGNLGVLGVPGFEPLSLAALWKDTGSMLEYVRGHIKGAGTK